MSDLLDDELAGDLLEIPEGFAQCNFEGGCLDLYPTTGPGGHFRRFCDVHQPPKKSRKSKKRPDGARPPRDTPPASIKIQIGAEKKTKDPELDAVEKKAKQFVQAAGFIVAMGGLAADGADIQKGAPSVAAAVRNLAEYEDWLKKLAAGGEMSGRTLAWIQLGAAVAGIAAPIALRHKALPPALMAAAEKAFLTAGDAAPSEAQAAAEAAVAAVFAEEQSAAAA